MRALRELAADPARAADPPRLVTASTLGDLLLRVAEARGDRDAVVFPEARRSYDELVERAFAVARSLVGLGVRPRDHVGILMPNSLEFVEVLFGVALAGGVAVPVNARYRTAELAYVIENAELRVLVTSDRIVEHVDFAALLHGALPGLAAAADSHSLSLDEAPLLRAVVMLGRSAPEGFVSAASFERLAGEVPRLTVESRREHVQVRDAALMMYTSGTTANPKGCPMSHEALTRVGAAAAARFRLVADDRLWNPLPLFHMGAILPLLAGLDVGAAFLSMVHFEPGEGLRLLVNEQATVAYPTFPAITQALVHHADFAAADLSQVRILLNVAPPDVQRSLQRAFPHAVQLASYGCTELGGVCAYTELEDTAEQRATLSGRAFPGMELRAVDPETGAPRPAGEHGELVGRGFAMFESYWRDPERTAAAIDEEGWFHTGDLGVVGADGRVAYLGRLKDMLKVGGENVAALEVESFLSTHPMVKIAQVVGIPDARLGEVPAAFVELAPNASLTEDELIAFCKGRIASFKVPRVVRFVEEWPMSATKVQKLKLRDELVAELAVEP